MEERVSLSPSPQRTADEPWLGRAIDAWFTGAQDFLLGRTTYEIFYGSWPKMISDDQVSQKINFNKKYVASRTLSDVEWETAELLQGDVGDAIRKLKAEDGGELQVHGSAGLIQTLLKEDLVDELRLIVFPVVLGEGKRLFGDGAVPAGLKLVDSSVFSSGVVLVAYEREGDVRYGSFALEEPNEAELARRSKLREG